MTVTLGPLVADAADPEALDGVRRVRGRRAFVVPQG